MFFNAKIVIGLFFVSSFISAQNLDALIAKGLAGKPSLKVIKERLLVNKAAIDLSTQFENPTLSFRMNDILLDDPSNRTLEPMQWSAIDFKQKIPFFGKRQASKNIAKIKDQILLGSLEHAKVNLVFHIKQMAFKIWGLEELIKIVNEYEKVSKHNISLSKSYASTSSSKHMDIMSAQLSLYKLRIQKEQLKAMIKASYARLSYLCATPVTKVDISLDITTKPQVRYYEEKLNSNLDLKIKNQELRQTKAKLQKAKLDHYPDTTMQVGYYYRENIDDFASVGVTFKLPIYGSEDYKQEQAQHNVFSKQSEESDLKEAIHAQFQKSFSNMTSAYYIYHIIVDESLPQVKHMSDIEVSSIATGGNLFKYIDVISKKFQLEQQKISTIASFHQAKARLEKLIGAIQ